MIYGQAKDAKGEESEKEKVSSKKERWWRLILELLFFV